MLSDRYIEGSIWLAYQLAKRSKKGAIWKCAQVWLNGTPCLTEDVRRAYKEAEELPERDRKFVQEQLEMLFSANCLEL